VLNFERLGQAVHALGDWYLAGLADLQASALAAALDQPYDDNSFHDDATGPRRKAQELGFAGSLSTYRHLLDHNPRTGYYLPLDFPIPFELKNAGDLVSVGSLPRLRTELESWKQHVPPYLALLIHSKPSTGTWSGARP
jgi:hypothetical protein